MTTTARFEPRSRAVDRPRATMISVRMDADEADILDTAAAAAGVSRSDMIRAAVSDYIGRAVRKHTRANAHDGRGG